MAKRKKSAVNKAAAIREYLATNPTAKGVEVVAALKAKGIKVAPAQVSNVKTAGKKKRVKRSGGFSANNRKFGRGRIIARVANIADKSLIVVESAITMLDHMTADAAKTLLDRLSRRKPR